MSDATSNEFDWIKIDGEKLDIPSSDVSDYHKAVQEFVRKTGGWLQVKSSNGDAYEIWVSPSSRIVVHYSR